MNIAIEVLVIMIILLILLVWAIWFKWSSKRLSKKYNPLKNLAKKGKIDILENDKGRRKEEPRIDSDDGRRDSEVEVGEQLIPRPTELAEPTILQTATARLSDKNRQRLRGVFGKSRRR